MKEPEGLHPSHVTRFSDSSTRDYVCVNCGASDNTGGGWGGLALPCPNPPVSEEKKKEPDKINWSLVDRHMMP